MPSREQARGQRYHRRRRGRQSTSGRVYAAVQRIDIRHGADDDPILGSLQYHKAGQLRVIAVPSATRTPNLPDVPTVAETIPGYEFYSWYGLWGPAKLPADIRAHLNAEVNEALASPDLRDKFSSQGLLLRRERARTS